MSGHKDKSHILNGLPFLLLNRADAPLCIGGQQFLYTWVVNRPWIGNHDAPEVWPSSAFPFSLSMCPSCIHACSGHNKKWTHTTLSSLSGFKHSSGFPSLLRDFEKPENCLYPMGRCVSFNHISENIYHISHPLLTMCLCQSSNVAELALDAAQSSRIPGTSLHDNIGQVQNKHWIYNLLNMDRKWSPVDTVSTGQERAAPFSIYHWGHHSVSPVCSVF